MRKYFFAAALLIAGAASAQKIEIAELPTPTLNFIEKYFPGVPVIKAKRDMEHGNNGYAVVLSNGTELEFWNNGSYREVDGDGKPIPTGFIDAKITKYVSENYPKQKITQIDYSHKEVDVELTGKLKLRFSKDGNILKRKNGRR